MKPAIIIAALLLSGCINLQQSYNSAARDECYKLIDATARQDCLTAVQRNASGKRNER